MRILYHHRTLGDGAEGIHIAEMVRAFRDLGHDVRVHGLAASNPARTGLISSVRGMLPGTVYELASAGCNLAEYVSVRREITRYRPDFVYKRHGRNDVAALAAARSRRIPTVLEVNCLFSSTEYRQFEPLAFAGLTARFERRALSSAAVVLAVSSPLAAQIRQLGVRDVTVLPNGANPGVFDPRLANSAAIRSRFGLEKSLTVGWAGILREWHGLELLVDAVATIPAVRLLIVGDGPARPQLEARIASLGLTERVALAGRVPHSEMRDYIAAMDIAVVAEDRTAVASPMKLLEYMAMARPVVAPRLDNIRDLVDDQADGVLFRAGDSAELAAALGRLAASVPLRRRLGENARRKIEQTRNWQRNAEAIVALVGGLDVDIRKLRGGVGKREQGKD